MKSNIFIELNGTKTDDKSLLAKTKEIWLESGNKIKDLSSVDLYYKPEEGKCYYVCNEDVNGSFDV